MKALNGMEIAEPVLDPGSEAGRSGPLSGLYCSQNFSVARMRWEKCGVRTIIQFRIPESFPYFRTIEVEFEGDVTDRFTSDADCLAAFTAEDVLRMLQASFCAGEESGRMKLRQQLREMLGID